MKANKCSSWAIKLLKANFLIVIFVMHLIGKLGLDDNGRDWHFRLVWQVVKL